VGGGIGGLTTSESSSPVFASTASILAASVLNPACSALNPPSTAANVSVTLLIAAACTAACSACTSTASIRDASELSRACSAFKALINEPAVGLRGVGGGGCGGRLDPSDIMYGIQLSDAASLIQTSDFRVEGPRQ